MNFIIHPIMTSPNKLKEEETTQLMIRVLARVLVSHHAVKLSFVALMEARGGGW